MWKICLPLNIKVHTKLGRELVSEFEALPQAQVVLQSLHLKEAQDGIPRLLAPASISALDSPASHTTSASISLACHINETTEQIGIQQEAGGHSAYLLLLWLLLLGGGAATTSA